MTVNSENTAYDHVISNLENRDWQCKLGKRYQKGFDITATKNARTLTIEVKSRTIGDYSPGGSLEQRTRDRRYFHFSDIQMKTADVFVCVFVSPKFTRAFVVPKTSFMNLRARTKKGNRLSFSPTRNIIKRDNKKIDVKEYLEGWHLLDHI